MALSACQTAARSSAAAIENRPGHSATAATANSEPASTGADAPVADASTSCDARYEQSATALNSSRIVQKTRGAAGTGLSVAASGSVAVTESVLIPTLALAGGAALCGAILAIEAAAQSDGHATGECVAHALRWSLDSLAEGAELDAARATWAAMADWRRESYDELALPLRDSIECSLDSGQEYDLNQARRRLTALRRDSGIWPHLSSDTRQRVLRLSRRLELRAGGRA